MKKILKHVFAAALLLAAGCAEEKIQPLPLAGDAKTSARSYENQNFSIHFTTNFEHEIEFYLVGTGGNINVDWGDGDSQEIYVDEYSVSFRHAYAHEGVEEQLEFGIQISGDLETITGFEFFYAGLQIDEIEFGGLPNLQSVSMGMLANGPIEINLSQNKAIESVILASVQRMENVILPVPNRIQAFDISGGNNLSSSVVNRLIANIHDSVVKAPRSGFFSLPLIWTQEETDLAMVGPPSGSALSKLRKLKRKYDWRLLPNLK